MATFTLKNIPDDLYQLLKDRAAANNRSINQEVIFCLRMELTRRKRTREEAEAMLSRFDAGR
jgi:plasmid stability protein